MSNNPFNNYFFKVYSDPKKKEKSAEIYKQNDPIF